jgi:formate hydrogenlyase subunit 6/NADH:ubiquinone oxidoreductase subunit I
MLPVLKIDLADCINCSLCRRNCPTEAINYFSTGRRTHVIDPDWCIGCDICAQLCPVDCIHEDEDYVIAPEQLALAKDKARDWAKRQRDATTRLRVRAARAAQIAANA